MRLKREALVENGPTVPEARRELEVPVLSELLSDFIAQVVVRPVLSAVDSAPLVVELRIEQHQPVYLSWPLGCVVAADAATKAGPEQTDSRGAGRFPDVSQRHPDVVEDRGQSQILLAAFALTVAAKIEAQAGQPRLSESSCQARGDSAILAGDTAGMHQGDRL